MKLAIIFLALFVAVSHQQYFHRGFFGFPWMSPYVQQPNYLFNLNHLIESRNMDRETELEVAPMQNYLPAPTSFRDNIFQDTQSRFKGFRPFAQRPSTFDQQEQQDAANGRFLFFSGSNTNRNNAFVRVATATVTSTCTAITFVTCIAFAMAVPICRRKRNALEHDLQGEDKDDSQFIINSTRVQWVMPTDIPSPAGKRDGRQVGVDDVISSSKDDITNDQQLEEFTKVDDQRRRGRFLYFGGDSVTTTLTSWSVLSTVITTSVPPGALACLPQGSIACPLPAGK